MKPRLLICTIVRDAEHHLYTWRDQIRELYHYVKADYDVELSVYENDSVDRSAEWLELDLNDGMKGIQTTVASEKLGTQRYGSVWNLDRLKNLANARQRCLDQAGPLNRFSKIAFIEPDVTYNPAWTSELILARHPRSAGLGEPDIYSGWSLRSEGNPKESMYLYDSCATRATCYDTSWDMTEANGTWRAKTVIPTDLGGCDSMCLHAVWSTFNCFCVYNARPFIEGAKWDYINRRLHTGQGWIDAGVYTHTGEFDKNTALQIGAGGFLDADTAVMCESFRARGYNQVYLNTNCIIRHA